MTNPNDDQIRAMLQARADRPDGAAPDEILDRVVRASRPGRTSFALPQLLGAIAAGALVVVVAGVLLTHQSGGPGATGSIGAGSVPGSIVASSAPSVVPSAGTSVDATPAPTVVQTSAAPATAAPASAAILPCLSGQLNARILSWQGAAGNRIADVAVTNMSRLACILAGHPGVQLRGSDGAVLIKSSTAGTTSAPTVSVDVAPGGQAAIEVDASNYCGPAPALPVTVALILPTGAGTIVAKPAPGSDDAFAVPPCMGSAPAVISTNGWTAAK